MYLENASPTYDKNKAWDEFINSATSRAGLHEKDERAEKWNLPPC